MQTKTGRRSNEQRTEATRAALIASARELFTANGYAATGTPEVVKRAGVTRGALYHHFRDKTDLLRAVVRAESQAVAREIKARTSASCDPLAAMIAGSDAYFRAMAVPGRARVLLIEAPSVLGRDELDAIDWETGGGSLRRGLQALLGDVAEADEIDALADLMSAMYDRAALSIAQGKPERPYRESIEALLRGLQTGPGA